MSHSGTRKEHLWPGPSRPSQLRGCEIRRPELLNTMMHFSCSSSARRFLFATVALAVLSAPVAHASVVNLVSNPDFSGGSPSSGAGYGSISGWTFGSADSGSNNLNGPFNNGASLPAGITTAGFIQSSANLGNPTNAATTTLALP